jgi:hypothetical protein
LGPTAGVVAAVSSPLGGPSSVAPVDGGPKSGQSVSIIQVKWWRRYVVLIVMGKDHGGRGQQEEQDLQRTKSYKIL